MMTGEEVKARCLDITREKKAQEEATSIYSQYEDGYIAACDEIYDAIITIEIDTRTAQLEALTNVLTRTREWINFVNHGNTLIGEIDNALKKVEIYRQNMKEKEK